MHELSQESTIIRTQFVEALLYYVGKTANIEDYQAFQTLIIEELPETIGEDMPTVFEQLEQKGKDIGFQEGRDIGAQQKTRQQIAEQLLAQGNLSFEDIAKVTNLLPSAIRELAQTSEAVS